MMNSLISCFREEELTGDPTICINFAKQLLTVCITNINNYSDRNLGWKNCSEVHKERVIIWGVNTLEKSFLSSQEIPNCNFTNENTNTVFVPMDMKKITEVLFSSWRRLRQSGHWVPWPYLSPLALKSSFPFSNSSTFSLFSLLLLMYKFLVYLSSLKSSWALACLKSPYTSRQCFWFPPRHYALPSTSCFFAPHLIRYGKTFLSGLGRYTKLVWQG